MPIIQAMITMPAWLGLVVTVLATSTSVQCPEITKTGQGPRLKVPPAIMRDVQSAVPGFRPLTMADFSDDVRKAYRFAKFQAPWAVIGDFDGDGFCDLVVDGRTQTDSYRLCAWGSAQGPGIVALGKRRLKGSTARRTAALTLVSRQELGSWVEERPGERLGDAFGEKTSRGLARIYYWKKGRFDQINPD